jgi:hypothetical protein
MSTGLIIVIVVVVLLLLALLLFVLPRARARSRERDLERRRGEVAGAHRDRAESRMARAEEAEQIAKRERAEADLHESRARLHERGVADDDEVRDEHERLVERDGPGGDEDRSWARGPGDERDAQAGTDRGDASDFERGREVGREEAAGGDAEAGARRDDRV